MCCSRFQRRNYAFWVGIGGNWGLRLLVSLLLTPLALARCFPLPVCLSHVFLVLRVFWSLISLLSGSRFHPRHLLSLIVVTLSLALSENRLDISILTYTHPPVAIFLSKSWFVCLRFHYPAVGTFCSIVNLLSCIFGLFPPIRSTLLYLFYHCGGFITLMPRYIIQSFYVSYRASCDLISSACFVFLLAFQFGPGDHYCLSAFFL